MQAFYGVPTTICEISMAPGQNKAPILEQLNIFVELGKSGKLSTI